MKTKKTFLVILLVAFFSNAAFAQTTPDFSSWLASFWRTSVAPLWPYILGIVGMVTAGFNLKHIVGKNKDYETFFTQLGMYVGGVAFAMIVISWAMTLSL